MTDSAIAALFKQAWKESKLSQAALAEASGMQLKLELASTQPGEAAQ